MTFLSGISWELFDNVFVGNLHKKEENESNHSKLELEGSDETHPYADTHWREAL